MPPTSLDRFVEALRHLSLLDAGLLDELQRSSKTRCTDPEALAQTLVSKGCLTPFQAEQILAGRDGELVLGQYLLLDRLGQGGMGAVYKARHQKLHRVVALKVIRADRLTNLQAVARFRREVHAVSQLAHPNVVLAYDSDQVGNTHFYAMEYAEGIDLGKLVDDCGPLPVGPACDYIRQAALGLQHAFEHGLVHRDIKPSNLLLTQAQGVHQVKLLDLGLSRMFSGEGKPIDATLTHAGSVVGTPDYMAPEQACDSHNVDTRADIYSLGCTLYYLLAGKVPYAGATAMETFFKHHLEVAQPIEALRGDLPRGLVLIVRRMMAKNPEGRFQTPAEAAKALEPFAQPAKTPLPTRAALQGKRKTAAGETLGQVDPRSPTRRVPAGGKRSRGLRGALIIGLGLLVLGVFGTLGTVVFSSSGKNKAGEASSQAGRATKTPPAASRVSLDNWYNRIGFTADGVPFTGGGLDNISATLSANLLGSSVNWNGNSYTLGRPGFENVVSAAGQTVALPAGNFSRLSFLATAVNTNQLNQTFTVAYTDGSTQTFTQSLSDWNTPQSYPGEASVVTMAYRNEADGTKDNKTFCLYGYGFPLNTAKQVQSITLPSNPNVAILAITLIAS